MKDQRTTDVALKIGSRLEPFVDDYLIDTMTGGLSLKLGSPRIAETVLRFDEKPWEGPHSTWVTVLQDEGRYRMYYRGGFGERGIPAQVCYAESTDGVHWHRPELNMFEFEGSKKNNIVCRDAGELSVFKDTNPDCRPEHRYKSLAGTGYNKPVVAYGSPDGIHWKLIQEAPVLVDYDGAAAAYDSHFASYWDPDRECYVVYHRAWYRPVKGKVRNIAVRTSPDFIHWTPLQLLDFGDTPPEHLYTQPAQPYFRAPHIILCFPKRFVPERRLLAEAETDGLSEPVFMSSRDGLHFDRRFMEAFVRPGRERLNWLGRASMISNGMLPTAEGEISFYISQHYTRPSNHLKRCVLRTDGFISVNATYGGGELLTRPVAFDGRELVINYATSAAGSVRVELADPEGRAIPGFEADKCPEIYGDEIDRTIQWEGGPDLDALSGRPVRLRFLLRDADLYSFRFRR